jgi:uncharacterized protein YcgI (DUF1989 family)
MTTLTARTGTAVRLGQGEAIRIVNIHGTQVVDTWALSGADTGEYLSMEHTRAALGKLSPTQGDALYSNARRVLATLIEDTSPGVHDTLIAACDEQRYALLGHVGYHANCRDNFHRALAAIGVIPSALPCPLNLFMNVPVEDGKLRFAAPLSQPGQSVTIRAETDLVMVLSACPQDLAPVNGASQRPTDVGFEILAAVTE